jgi:hypothetical protein
MITFKLCYVWDPGGWTIGLSVDQLLLTEPTEQGGQPPAAVAVPALIGADIIVELHDFLRIDVDITPRS